MKQVESLLTEICDTTSIAEVDLKVSWYCNFFLFILFLIPMSFAEVIYDLPLMHDLSSIILKFFYFLWHFFILLLAWWISFVCEERLDRAKYNFIASNIQSCQCFLICWGGWFKRLSLINIISNHKIFTSLRWNSDNDWKSCRWRLGDNSISKGVITVNLSFSLYIYLFLSPPENDNSDVSCRLVSSEDLEPLRENVHLQPVKK